MTTTAHYLFTSLPICADWSLSRKNANSTIRSLLYIRRTTRRCFWSFLQRNLLLLLRSRRISSRTCELHSVVHLNLLRMIYNATIKSLDRFATGAGKMTWWCRRHHCLLLRFLRTVPLVPHLLHARA